jgi:hypothetical protein
MATGDMDKDGFEDFVVGAPGYNVKGSPQEGRVYNSYLEMCVQRPLACTWEVLFYLLIQVCIWK